MDAKTTEQTGTPSTLGPQYFYGYFKQGLLYRISLLNEKRSSYQLPGYEFRGICQLNELPDGSLVITGGSSGATATSEVEKIDTLREFALSSLPPMHTPRYCHAAVVHYQYLYVLAGWNAIPLRRCERYVWAESRWEDLPELPVAGSNMSAVVLDNSLYALGGSTAAFIQLDTVQKLSLDSLTWELMDLKLPFEACSFPCFKIETQVFLQINWALYSFTPLEFKKIKTLDIDDIYSSLASCYGRGILYYTATMNGMHSIQLGELTDS
jgi:hypothetical protein